MHMRLHWLAKSTVRQELRAFAVRALGVDALTNWRTACCAMRSMIPQLHNTAVLIQQVSTNRPRPEAL